jgi:hypothetical protein
MLYLFLKTIITGITIVAVSEIAKRSSWVAAALASLPLTSILAMIWLYIDTRDVQAVVSLSISIFWMVLPSLLFFMAFPLLVKAGLRFYPALAVSILTMCISYVGYVRLLEKFGVIGAS